jgi:hypothetical protein
MWRAVVGAVWAAAAIVADASAASVTNPIRIGSWSGGAYSKEQSRLFDHCRASASNAAGTTVRYAVNRARWSLMFSNPGWNFVSGHSLPLLLKLGDRDTIRGQAFATERQLLEVVVEDNMALFARLRSAAQMKVTAGGLAFDFELVDGDEVLSALSLCLMHSTGMAGFSESSKGRRTSEKPTPLRPDGAATDEAKTLAAEILGFARWPNARLVSTSDAAMEPRPQAGFKAGLVSGMLAVLVDEGRIEDLSDRLIGNEARRCQRGGLFFVAGSEAIDGVSVGRLFASCKTSEAISSSYHLLIPRPQGGAYLITSTAYGGGFAGTLQKQTEEVDARVRAVITSALKRLGEASPGIIGAVPADRAQ